MIWVVVGELGVAVLAGLVFMVLYAARSPWRASALGRHIMATTAVVVGESLTLLLLGLGVPLPPWVFAVGFGLLDAVLVQRVVLLLRVQDDDYFTRS